jgi:hypothetical protein
MEKIVNKLIDHSLINVDKYSKDNSTWLIFTDTRQWVIELTNDGTLWYNYNFFKNLFAFVSLDVVDSQSYITKWVEKNVLNTPVKKDWGMSEMWGRVLVDDTIQNGVKFTGTYSWNGSKEVEDTMQTEVKFTLNRTIQKYPFIDNVVQNGEKEKFINQSCWRGLIEDMGKTNETKWTKTTVELNLELGDSQIVEKNVEMTLPEYWMPQVNVNSTIDSGIKETLPQTFHRNKIVKDVINGGVGETKPMDEWVNSNRIIDVFMDGAVKSEINRTYAWDNEIFGEPKALSTIGSISPNNP